MKKKILNNEDYLNSEDNWEDDFKVNFIKINKDGTEWWEVNYPANHTSVSCTSMLQAFKIAFTAEEILSDGEITHRTNSSAEDKAHWLFFDRTLKNKEVAFHKMRGEVFYDGIWHKKRKRGGKR